MLFFFKARRVSNSSSALSSTRRIVLRFITSLLNPGLGFRQGEIKGCASVDGALRPDAPAMALDNALNGGQPGAGAREFIASVQPLKSSKETGGVNGVEAGAIIADEIGTGRVGTCLGNLDARGLVL